MPTPTMANIKGQVRAAIITLPVGFALFIGGIAAIATNAVTLGEVLIAAAVVSLGIGLVLLFRVKNETRAAVRDSQAKRQADLEAALRDYPGGGRLP
jgi:Zn-dependent membrane protease YugP